MIDTVYFRQAELLLRVLPLVDREAVFALKSGTAINFFVRDLPRVSVRCPDAFQRGNASMGPDWPGRGSEPACRPMEALEYRSNGSGQASASPS